MKCNIANIYELLIIFPVDDDNSSSNNNNDNNSGSGSSSSSNNDNNRYCCCDCLFVIIFLDLTKQDFDKFASRIEEYTIILSSIISFVREKLLKI